MTTKKQLEQAAVKANEAQQETSDQYDKLVNFEQGIKQGYRSAMKDCSEITGCEECKKTLGYLTNKNGKENN